MQRLPVSRSEVLAHIAEIDASKYARRRNHTDGGTQISAFLTRGLVSLPEERDDVLQRHTPKQAHEFVYELAWREYWQRGSKKYVPAQKNVNTYSAHPQQGGYLDHDYDVLAEMTVPEQLSERADPDLTWAAPQGDPISIDAAKPTVLHHCFWLNAAWRADQEANRVVSLEPSWFARFPVSPIVTEYIVRCAREIPGAQVIVAEFDDLDLGSDVYFMRHPSVAHWRGTAEEIPRLFPQVPDKSFGSFTSYWKQCEKTMR